MNIAYILNSYPQPSHSFIRREIRALEAQGHVVTRLAMRAGDMALVDTQDLEEAAATQYVLRAGITALLHAVFQNFCADPKRFARALKLAIACGRRSESGILKHLIYMVEGAYVVQVARAAQATHAHAHFGTNAASVAMLSQALGGPDYSFTVHGPEEYDAPRALSLGTKVQRSKFTVAITSYGRSQLSRWVGPDHWSKIKVVHCGIDAARFPTPHPLPDGSMRFVAVGRFVEQKGQLLALEAMSDLLKSHPTSHLTLIGDGEMRGEIEGRITHLGLGDHVTLTGWLDEDQLLEELQKAHALVMPSFAEGLPMVIMEAMAAGRVVIATYIAGIPELVQQGETGWLVPAGDAGALAQAMAEMADTAPQVLEQMTKAARTRVLARHDVDAEAAKLAALIAAP
ncbi:glycosyltransferase family 4 protein [Sulfitobacter guttiformis]|uniref:Glycosyltransferase involved in cell wall biosynthesis n=1 Tax=Sulfitobacter guttiformis TaxID=74349 RepID=A0A420DNX2_9RHOB|nr:glycosyltransferase family 4 protein [Sulfitobacter guttiformis]KIN73195.1 Glycosyl transferase, group 1 family protein [Sulfitobacter guttiformis KCTC 32187]RKE95873.1 glycosyltransferase involved in cell wall biosynthesis [Sulfitobacter guttiformis]